MGSSIESETWQPGKVKTSKLNMNISYPAVMNYWTPLYENNKEEELEQEEINILQQSTKTK